ncbi:DUF948 domain-containing protein [Romeria aff. gracilis LEGE 07310]|uniref:DUF948 domain-containing protein n=1 Tax=Vasconcelosia minhoensis LEGE 07310 TaxID=915328 RepID=A0A8J7A9L2_9CYAN|nr:DUF948 domain-containing protein [Romeria gracilis]MBE9079817.1 DUF948 domain-containing protein [Romeria aff. gracilis LEGE 07310]
MSDPLFWLGLSLLLVAVSLMALLVTAIPAMRELARAARSAEKLCDLLSRELPETLEAIRQTGGEVSELSTELANGLQSASQLVEQVDRGMVQARQQARQAQVTSRSLWAGTRAALKVFMGRPPRRRRPPTRRPPLDAAISRRPAAGPSADPAEAPPILQPDRPQPARSDSADSRPE